MLSPGNYYSYDSHYFYKDLKTLIKDYKKGNYNNSINKNKPYYNYYMYLSNHTKTAYSSINIDEWKKVIYGLLLSLIIGFALGFMISKIIKIYFLFK